MPTSKAAASTHGLCDMALSWLWSCFNRRASPAAERGRQPRYEALSDGAGRDTSAQRTAAARDPPDLTAAAWGRQDQSSAAAHATVRHVTPISDRSTARPHHGVLGSHSAVGEPELLPATGDTGADPSSAATRVLPAGSARLEDALDLTPQHAQPSSLEENGAGPADNASSEVSPLAAFGSPVHVHEHCSHEQPATSAEGDAAEWWCERTDGPAAAQWGGGQHHSKPRWRGSTALPRPPAAGVAGNKENDCTPTPALQDSEFITPSPMGHGAGFVVEGSGSGGATGGTPRIVGLANSVTKFREDRRVSTRLTPFTERVDKEVERERWTKQKLAMRRQSSLGERCASQLLSS